MTLRNNLFAGAVGAGLVLAMAAPAAAERVRWDLGSTYASSLRQLGTLGVHLVEKIERASGGDIVITFNEPGALVPALETFDAVASGSIDAAWSTPGYWAGKDPTFAMFSAVPFGPAAGEYLAWIYYGGGRELQDELYAQYGLKSIPCGIIAPEASGWFQTEITSTDQLNGLKMRFFGLGARVMEAMGVSTQLLAGGEIYQALELGTIDATEFSMPAIDLSLGFQQVAKHYYFPGWHQQSTIFELLISLESWDGLEDQQKAIIELACGDAMREGLAEGEAIQFAALQELQAAGVTLHRWPDEVLAELEAKWNEVAASLAAESPTFAKVWESYSAFRENYRVWKDLGYLD
jgi:TRAP-type mannitol/chloroaromatic compound transport system substrate-binding protein